MDLKSGDYIAHRDETITIIWRGDFYLHMYLNATGESLGSIRNPDLDHTDEADWAAEDWAALYHEENA